MGLDMYAYTTEEKIDQTVDFEDHSDWACEFHYWRKHPNLHGWMERLYREKGGKADSFNCVNVMLDAADLDRLEADVKAGRLPQTTGFFFGCSDGSEVSDDLAFIKRARQFIEDGEQVYYRSWW